MIFQPVNTVPAIGAAFMRKRILSILSIIIILSLFLCSCSNGQTKSASNKEDSLPVLTIGSSSYNPYFYIDENGAYTGIDQEIATEACRRLHYRAVFKEVAWGEQTQKLNNGKIDCIWGGFAMNGGEEEYQWAGPYLLSPIKVCVRADSDIYSFDDLRGKTVGVLVNSRGEHYFLTQDYSSSLAVSSYNSLESAFAAFNKGFTDAVVGHETGLDQFTKDSPDLYRYLDTPVHIAQLGVAFKKGTDSDFPEKLTQTLAEMNEDGTIPAIAKKYGLNASNFLEVTSDDN